MFVKKNFTENKIVEKDLPKKTILKEFIAKKKFHRKKNFAKKRFSQSIFASKILFFPERAIFALNTTFEVDIWHLGSTYKNMIKHAVLDGSVWLIFGLVCLVWFP